MIIIITKQNKKCDRLTFGERSRQGAQQEDHEREALQQTVQRPPHPAVAPAVGTADNNATKRALPSA